MADIARAMGVAPGTLYLYVESKEALFDLVVQRAFETPERGEAPALPLPTPTPERLLEHVRRRGRVEAALPLLEAALARKRVVDVEDELRGIVRELYRVLSRSRRAVKLMERSALDWPELAAVWVGEIRHGLITRLTQYVERRVRRKHLRHVDNVDATARLVLETAAWFAVHRHGDAAPPPIDEATAEETVVDVLVHGLIRRTP